MRLMRSLASPTSKTAPATGPAALRSALTTALEPVLADPGSLILPVVTASLPAQVGF